MAKEKGKTRPCAWCGKLFERSGASKYCNDVCRKAGYAMKRQIWSEQNKNNRLELKKNQPKLKPMKPKITLEKAVKMCEKYGKTYGQLQKEGLI